MFLLVLFSSIALAAGNDSVSLEEYDIKMYVEYRKVLVESEMVFPAKQSANFSIELPFDARGILTSLDGKDVEAELDANSLVFMLRSVKKISYSYITNDPVDDDSIVVSLRSPFDADVFRISLYLPENAVLDKPMKKGSVSGSPVYPAPSRLETDGQSIIVVWEFQDVKKDDEIAFYVKYRKPLRYMIPTMLFAFAVLVIAGSAAYLIYRRKPMAKPEEKSIPRSSEGIETHLKEDEEQVINVLKLKEGSCEQGTLRIATGFSKAKLSGLLKEMEERKVIHKEKRGKKNRVFIRE